MTDGKDKPQIDAIVVKIAKLELRPGDALVIQAQRELSAGEVTYLRQAFRDVIPDECQAILLQPDVGITILQAVKRDKIIIPQ